jgi:hypothetical protein
VGSEVTQWKAGKAIRIEGEHKACDDGQKNKYKHSTNIKMKKQSQYALSSHARFL